MPGYHAIISRLPALPLLAGISLAIGFLVPSVFEMAQKPASQHRHDQLELSAFIVLAATALVCTAVSLLRKRQAAPEHEIGPPGTWQFDLLQLFLAITMFAIALAIMPLLELWVASAVIVALILAITAWAWRSGPSTGARITALLAVMFLPFVWMIAYSVPLGRTSGLIAVIPIAPGILVAELLRGLAGLQRDKVESVAAIAVMIQLLMGAWLARQGPRGSLTFSLLVLAASSAGSLLLHILYRA
jgi:hypothetical protein